MIGFKVLANSIDVTKDVISCTSSHPTILNGAVPTCDIILSNRGGTYSTTLPTLAPIQVTYPNNLNGSNSMLFRLENPEYKYNPRATLNGGKQVLLHGTAAPETLLLSEGNLDVVGTDLPVPYWNTRGTNAQGTPDVQYGFVTSQFYIPYASTYLASLGTPVMDIGNALTALLHTGQPNQSTLNYRGRLGYDCTGLGVNVATGIDYQQGALGWYIKGQWKVGQGSTGAQQYGIDIIKNILAKNVIDANGNNIVADGYIDATNPVYPLLKIHARGNLNSFQTITQGVDPILDIDLPYSTDDIMNFILYWANDEAVYPTSGDAWSNYNTTANMKLQWLDYTLSGFTVQGSGSFTIGTNTASSSGTSLEFTNNSASGVYSQFKSFNLANNGYSNLTKLRNLQNFNFNFARNYQNIFDFVQVLLMDANGNYVSVICSDTTSTLLPASPPTWGNVPIPIPSSGLGIWNPGTGSTWDFSVNTISSVLLFVQLGYNTSTGQQFWLDNLQFVEDYNYSPDYSYNLIKPASTVLTSSTNSSLNTIAVFNTTGFVAGQFITIDPLANAETIQLSSIQTPNQLTLVSAPQKTHTVGSVPIPVTGATHDPNSINAYGPRTFNFVDFYVQDGAADGSDSVALNILNSRKAKKSTGTITLSGYAAQNKNIVPTSLITLVDSVDVYAPTGSIYDSLITGYVVDQIDYSVDSVLGYTVKYTVEPWYATLLSTSPDNGNKNFWRPPMSNPTTFRLNQARKANALVTPGF